MLYAESLRHFVQEWVEIQHPKDNANWPWDPKSRLFLINLYSISGSDILHEMPSPFISILINGLEKEQPWMIRDEESLYRKFFEKDTFSLPRRYLYDPFNGGEKSIGTNRYSFTSDGYGDLAADWRKPDLRLLRVLASRPHVRYNTLVGTDETAMLLMRLDALADAADVGNIKCAEDLFDFTTRISGFKKASPDLMLIQCPLSQNGIQKPIRKSKEYRIINGVLVVCNDPVMMSIKEEPCDSEYRKSRTPFKDIIHVRGHLAAGEPNIARAISYVAVEAQCGIFSFQEFTPSHSINTSKNDNMIRVLNHVFTVKPEEVMNKMGPGINVRLHHTILESLVPNTPANQKYFRKSKNEKLYARTNLPDGYCKDKDGKLVINVRVR